MTGLQISSMPVRERVGQYRQIYVKQGAKDRKLHYKLVCYALDEKFSAQWHELFAYFRKPTPA